VTPRLGAGDIPHQLPVLGLPEAVLMPGEVLKLPLSESATLAAQRAVNGLVAAVAQRRAILEGLKGEDFHDVGTVARVVEEAGRVVLHGLAPCRIEVEEKSDPRLGVRVQLQPDEDIAGSGELVSPARTLALQLLEQRHGAVPDLDPLRLSSLPGDLSHLIASRLPLPLSVKQQLLETASVRRRLTLLQAICQGMLASEGGSQTIGTCPLHGQRAYRTCTRCGNFICEACKGVYLDPELCPECRTRAAETERRKKLEAEQVHGPVWVVELCGIAGIGIALVASQWQYQPTRLLVGSLLSLGISVVARVLARKSTRSLFGGTMLIWIPIGLSVFNLLRLIPWLVAQWNERSG
jgi:Lon protease-like protein